MLFIYYIFVYYKCSWIIFLIIYKTKIYKISATKNNTTTTNGTKPSNATMPISPTTNATKAAVMSEADMIKDAWKTDPNMDIFFYVIYGLSYAATIIPSIFGIGPIATLRTVMFFYLAYDALVRYFDLDKKPKA